MSIGGSVQEIQLDKITHAHQNHKTWSTSRAYSSKSNPRIFRKHRDRSLIWCKSGLDGTLRSCAMGAWIWPISEPWSWTRLLQRSHIPYFPDNLYSVSTTRSSSRLSHSLSLRPYSNSSSQFHYSCIPHSISLWNSLPIDPSNYNFVDFKSVLSNYLIN